METRKLVYVKTTENSAADKAILAFYTIFPKIKDQNIDATDHRSKTVYEGLVVISSDDQRLWAGHVTE